jgi:hypothetical protein
VPILPKDMAMCLGREMGFCCFVVARESLEAVDGTADASLSYVQTGRAIFRGLLLSSVGVFSFYTTLEH